MSMLMSTCSVLTDSLQETTRVLPLTGRKKKGFNEHLI